MATATFAPPAAHLLDTESSHKRTVPQSHFVAFGDFCGILAFLPAPPRELSWHDLNTSVPEAGTAVVAFFEFSAAGAVSLPFPVVVFVVVVSSFPPPCLALPRSMDAAMEPDRRHGGHARAEG